MSSIYITTKYSVFFLIPPPVCIDIRTSLLAKHHDQKQARGTGELTLQRVSEFQEIIKHSVTLAMESRCIPTF